MFQICHLQRDLRIIFPNEESGRLRVEVAPETVCEVFQYGVCHTTLGLDFPKHFRNQEQGPGRFFQEALAGLLPNEVAGQDLVTAGVSNLTRLDAYFGRAV
jgi:hypothetical protein